MSRILLLILFLLWMAMPPSAQVPPTNGELAIFLGGFAVLVLVMGLWSRLLAGGMGGSRFSRRLRRYNRIMAMVRLLIPAWFALGLILLGWKQWVLRLLGPLHAVPVELPGMLLGTLPAFLAWCGLLWSQYPAERALREQSILSRLDEDLPVHAPPGFWSYFWINLRLQMLFTAIPIIGIVFLRDLATLGFWLGGRTLSEMQQGLLACAAAGSIFLLAPLLLKRILRTEPLPPSPLRCRLEEICCRYNLRYRDVLLWRTDNNLGNAAVMGLVAPVRYILMSDLLLETMSDEQIEAVFAHEVGHIVHRHLLWYVVFVVTFLFVLAGPGQQLYDLLAARIFNPALTSPAAREQLENLASLATTAAAAVLFFFFFGFLSRRFERQADVFAARTLEKGELASAQQPQLAVAAPAGPSSIACAVTPRGASIFASALQRVAIINNMPISGRRWAGGNLLQFMSFFLDRAIDSANNWLHGSISWRMNYLEQLGAEPARTARFDRFMSRVYGLLIVCLMASAGWVAGMWLTHPL